MSKLVKKLLLIGSVLFSTLLYGGFGIHQAPKFLTPEEAFHVTITQNEENIITTIGVGHDIHIYKEGLKLNAKANNTITLEPTLPEPINKDGELIYESNLTIVIPTSQITSKLTGDYTLTVTFQGCSNSGLCYAPITKSAIFTGKQPSVWEKIATLSKEGNASKIVEVLVNESWLFVLFLFFIFGLLLSLTPCIFPMIPILSSIIVSQQGKKDKPNMSHAFMTSLVYVLAMALTYTIVGLIAGLVGADLQAAMQNPWILSIFAGLFIALALSLFGYYEIGLPSSLQSKLMKVSDNAQGKGILGTAIMGALSALIVGPCTAAPISGAVLFISHTGNAFLGGGALFVMSIGMGLPLLLVGLGAGKFMPRPGGWMTKISQAFGVMMLALAIFMLSRILPASLSLLLWSLLLMGTALYMGVFQTKENEGAMKLFRLLAMVFLLYGASIFVGALSGAKSVLHPFEQFTTPHSIISTQSTTQEEKNTHLGYSIAKIKSMVEASKKPVVIDFGKDSCTACAELEEITFPDPLVQEELKRFTFIKINLTNNTEDDKAMLKEYGLFGTPNIIFFGKDDNYLSQKSLTGFIKPEDFVTHLKTIQ